jgi:hypothetical protein
MGRDDMAAKAVYTYDPVDNILEETHPNLVDLATREEMRKYFDDGVRFWRASCGGGKVYILMDYNNLRMNLDELDFYASQVKRMLLIVAITVVRYGGEMLQRTAGRMTAIKLHTPSKLYRDRDAALKVVRGLKEGAISLSASHN